MPADVQGRNSQVIRQVEERFETDRFGVDTIQLTVEIPDALFPGAIAPNGSLHPRFSAMALSRRSGTRTKPRFWTVSYVFEGFLFEMPEPYYELQGSLDQEPIQAHPDFVSKIAGKPSDAKNGAVFIDPNTFLPTTDDAKGVFREFAATISGAANPKGGLESYLVPGAEWREISFSTSRPSSLNNLGKIQSPSGPNPSLGGRSWLAWSNTYQKRGHIYQITKTWKLSGPRGWDSDVY